MEKRFNDYKMTLNFLIISPIIYHEEHEEIFVIDENEILIYG